MSQPEPLPRTVVTVEVVELEVGPGDGARLLAPGAVDALAADGARLGWLSRGALVLTDGPVARAVGRVRMVALGGEPEHLVATPSTWLVLAEGGLTAVDPVAGTAHALAWDLVEGLRSVAAGAELVVLRTARGHAAYQTSDGAPVALPAGVLRARVAAPFLTGSGVLWATEETLYRARALPTGELAPEAVGTLPTDVAELVAGPDGCAAVGATDGSTWVLSPRGRAVPLEDEILVRSAAFSGDGSKVLAIVAGGVAELDTATGKLLRRWDGALAPVGYAPEALLHDDPAGFVRDVRRDPVLRGLGFGGPALDPPRLYGPGGTAWDLAEGSAVWSASPLEGGHTVTDGERVLHLGERRARLFDEHGAELAAWDIPLFQHGQAASLLSAVRTAGGAEEDEDEDEVAEAAWLEVGGQAGVVVLTWDGVLARLHAHTGEVLWRDRLAEYVETEGWPGLLGVREGLLVRDGDGARRLPAGEPLAAPPGGAQVEALVAQGRAVARSWGGRVELVEDGKVRWSSKVDARLLAWGRHLYAVEGDDLIVLDAATGNARDRSVGAMAGCTLLRAASDGDLYGLGGAEGSPLVVRLRGRDGAVLRRWAVPADGVAVARGRAWVWTDEGQLLALPLQP